MRYYQYIQSGLKRVGVEDESGGLIDLTALDPRIGSTLDLLNVASITNTDIDSVTRAVLSSNKSETSKITVEELLAGAPIVRYNASLVARAATPGSRVSTTASTYLSRAMSYRERYPATSATSNSYKESPGKGATG